MEPSKVYGQFKYSTKFAITGLGQDLDECSMDEVGIIDDYTAQFESYIALELVSTIMAAVKSVCRRLKLT